MAEPRDSGGGPLAGRTAIVTGGSRGIGRAVSVALARDGAAGAVNYRSAAPSAEQLAAELTAATYTARAFGAALESNEQIEEYYAFLSGRMAAKAKPAEPSVTIAPGSQRVN